MALPSPPPPPLHEKLEAKGSRGGVGGIQPSVAVAEAEAEAANFRKADNLISSF